LAELLHGYAMTLTEEQLLRIERFFSTSKFRTNGAVITDLDGTAVHEFEGRTIIHKSVEIGLKKIYDIGRPIVINTLRFPLSVIRTFALDWYTISNAPIPVVLLNGSQLGYIIKVENEFAFEQLQCFPLSAEEIKVEIERLQQFTDDGIQDMILFYYPEDWKNGEIIWTPDPQRIPHLQQKYTSASSVISMSLNDLLTELLKNPVCMILVLVDIPSDKLMAYQHTKRSHFVTHQGVDKLTGTGKIASLLHFDLEHSVGAGDTDMDNFLKAVGMSVHIGRKNLPFEGLKDTLRLRDFVEYGDLLNQFAYLQTNYVK
jgi:hydroxymethylpyrimidine pyrophosphatase-like HAD family hydrolase